MSHLCQAPVTKSHEGLVARVDKLAPTGSTALGPAVALAVGLTAKAPGSKIIVCTDGAANMGVGSIPQGAAFYPEISNQAKELATSISVITMEGEDCSMENLGTAADITGGNVEVVDPLDLTTKVSRITGKSVLATKVEITVFLPHQLIFRGDQKAENLVKKVTRELASATEESDVTFSFEWDEKVRNTLKPFYDKLYDEDRPAEPYFVKGLPVQIQVSYNNTDGDRLQKILTISKPVINSRSQAEDSINSSVVSLQAIQESARLAQLGYYNEARINLLSVQRLLQRTMKVPQTQRDYLSYIVQAEKLDQFMREAQSQNEVIGSNLTNRDDAASQAMFQMKSISLKTFNSRS